MPFSVTNVQGILSAGLARPTQYLVYITGPNVVSERSLNLLCEAAEFPGKGFQTTPLTMYGVQLKLPYNFFYDDLSLTFAVPSDMSVKKWFDLWQARICHPVNYYFEYFDNYKADIEIVQLDEMQRPTYLAKVEDAFPVRTSAMALSYSQSNEYHKLTVTFAYRRWRNFRQLHEMNGEGAFVGKPGGNLDPLPGGLNRQPNMKSPGAEEKISEENSKFMPDWWKDIFENPTNRTEPGSPLDS